MVQRVTVSPSEVRGYGDIVSPKTTEDFTEYMCELSESDGVYTMVYDDTATYLTLSASPTTILYGESTVLTATLTVEGEKASGETVYFYEGETLLGSDETDSNGVATLTKSDFTISTHSVKAVYDEIESNTVNVVVNKAIPTITLSTDKTALLIGDTFTLSGTFSLTSGTVKLYDGNTFIEDLTVTGGAFSKTITGTLGTHNYKVISVETSEYESVTSSTVNVYVVDGSDYMELEVTGSSFSSYNNSPFNYTGAVYVDWGDNTGLIEYTGGQLSHTYSNSGSYSVKIYGNITGLRDSCFGNCTGLTSIIIPESVISLGMTCFGYCTGLTSIIIPESVISLQEGCFISCTGLTEIVLNWDSASEILTYNSNWIYQCTSFDHFLIPEGTKSLYTAKNYPSNLLKEDGEPTPATITLTGTKNILSYADSESSVLTATVLDDNDDPVEGVSVELYKDSVLWDTLTTSSAGTVSKTYTSVGIGDVGFKAECGSLVTENFPVQDCYRYDNATSDKSSNYTKTSNLNVSHSTDHYILTASSNNSMMCIGSGYDNVRYEFLMSGTSHFARGLYCSDTQNYYETNSIYNIYQTNNNNKRIQMADITGGSWSAIKETSYTFTNNTYYRFIIEINGTSITLKVETEDGTVIESQTVTKSLNAHYVGTLMYSGTAYVKDIKVKAL